eukprot:CAMPEP_0201539660 /NCGR_PEP_ID=MMETSP0161_2-20130828/70527_1 /ASSEMBLY_ACC=CAM_ASM_000251 /TAXON_ID=180227 /ORGANISM="Neoparamoeba aestuarina, Strain SoJaBio B1-5/56/2" /LENGTH=541 /DNA_ID=CAMNT_0047947071 /DNA_START=84 /DNA_END=1709 /DNA_ORIENTATION=-
MAANIEEENDPEYLTKTLERISTHSLTISDQDPIPIVHPSPSLHATPQAKEGYRIRLVAGTGNRDLSLRISEALGVKLESADNKKFADGEIALQVHENVRGADVYIIQPMCPPNVNDNIMELLLLIHTLRLSSAKRVTAICPYYAYGRQDRKVKPRVQEENDPEYLTKTLERISGHSLTISDADPVIAHPSPSLHAVPQAKEGYRIRLLSGTANRDLSLRISEALGVKLESADNKKFADGEINLQIHENVRGADVYIIQPMCPPNVNDNIMELLLLIHTLRLSSAKRVTAICPYYAYGRQDRKVKPRVPISASAVAQLLEAMAPSRVVTVDLHCGQIQGFFHQTPVDNLFAENEMLHHLKSKNFPKDKLVIVSPDAGGVLRANRIADKMRARGIVTILKRRLKANAVESMQLVGDVTDTITVIVDDMIDTGGTLCKAAALLKENGATKVYAVATHGLFSGPAMERINNSCMEEVCVTDSIPQKENLKVCAKLTVITLAPLLAETIRRLHTEKSLSNLFDSRRSNSTAPPVQSASGIPQLNL